MSTHNIGFYEDLTKNTFKLTSNIIKYAPYFFCCLKSSQTYIVYGLFFSDTFQSCLTIFIALHCVGTGVLAGTSSQAETLYKDVLTNYTKEVRPVLDQDDPVDVNITLSIYDINSFEELSGTLESSQRVILEWREERINWNESDYGMISSIHISNKLLWTPRILLGKAAGNIAELGMKSAQLRVLSDGRVTWDLNEIIHSKCSVDVTMFPFDTQTCGMLFLAKEYSTRELILTPTQPTQITGDLIENSQWIMKSKTIIQIGQSKSLPGIKMEVVLERRYLFYVYYIMCPLLFLALLNMAVFYLPPSSGERTSVAVTIFLAFIVYMSVLNDTVPTSSNPVAHIYVILFSMVLYSSIIVLLCAISLRIYDSTGEVPTRTQTVVRFLRFGWIFNRIQHEKEGQVQIISVLPTTGDTVSRSKEKEAFADTNLKFENSSENLIATEKKNITWQLVGNTFDLYCMFVCVCFVLVSSLSFALPSLGSA